MKKLFKKTVVLAMAPMLLLGVLVAVFAYGNTAQAQDKSWKMSNWDTKITINKDSSFDVVDTVTFDFTGSFSYINRTIDWQKFDSISNYQVLDENDQLVDGGSYIYYDSGLGAYVNRIDFNANNESRTFTFRYTINGGIGYFEDHDELYWNVLPSDRDVVVERATVEVTLPDQVPQDAFRYDLFSEGDALKTTINDTGQIVYSGTDFEGGSNMTIVAGWPTGFVYNPGIYRIETTPSSAEVYINDVAAYYRTPISLRADGYDLNNGRNELRFEKFGYETTAILLEAQPGVRETIPVMLERTWWLPWLYAVAVMWFLHPLLTLFVLVRRWYKRGKDPRGRSTIIAEYEPPDELPPTLVGTLVDEQADMHDITASIVDLARRGYLNIRQMEKKFAKTQNFEFTKQKDFTNDTKLFEYEQLLLEHIFKSKDKVRLSDLKNKFYTHLPAIKKSIYNETLAHQYFEENPDKKRKKYYGFGAVMVFLGFFVAGFFAIGVPLVIDGILTVIFGRFMPKRTPKGVTATQHTLGFKEYLFRAERYRVQKLTPETFEKFLPYAMVFKIEEEWAKKFKDIFTEDYSPSWYTGYYGSFSALALSNSMHSMSNSAVSAMTTAPGGGGSGASGGSGFSGGGFSGGGGGGGGISAG